MKMTPFSATFLLTTLLLIPFTSCKKELRNQTAEENLSSQNRSSEDELLKSLRSATSRFHSTTQAINEGHIPDEHCVSVPGLGGMGYHWVNPALVDAEFDLLKPEAILYATGADGKLRLVALEYIVVNVGQARPMFGSQPFDVGGTPLPAPHWSLHVWLYENNPSGMFRPFNPNVTCP